MIERTLQDSRKKGSLNVTQSGKSVVKATEIVEVFYCALSQ
jgi:hypothetical protein